MKKASVEAKSSPKSASPYLTTPYKAPPVVASSKKSVSPSKPLPNDINAKKSNSPVKARQNPTESMNGVSAQLKEKNSASLTNNSTPPKKTASTTSNISPQKQNNSPSSIEKTKKDSSLTPTRTIQTKPVPNAIGKSSNTSKSTSKTSPSTFDKYAVYKKIPSDIVLIILDYYGGVFKKSSLTENDGKIEYSNFIKKFYGRFNVDKSIKFMFRFIEGDHQAINNMKESIELVRLAFVGSQKIRITGSVADYLLNCPNKADPSLAMRKLDLFASALDEDCKKVIEVDFVGRETFSELCSLFFKLFTNLEIIRGGRHMRKRRDNDYDTRFHAFDTSMASALEVGGPYLKEIKWLGSSLPKNLASFTPNLERVHVGKFNFLYSMY